MNKLTDFTIEKNTLHGPLHAQDYHVGALTLGSFILEVCERYTDNEALVIYDADTKERISWSYSKLLEQALQFAQGLIALGANKSSRIGIVMGTRPECVAAIFGSALAGALVVPLSTLSSRDELKYLVGHADIDYLVTQTVLGGKHRLLDSILSFCPEAMDVDVIRSTTFPYLKKIIALGVTESKGALIAWNEFIASGSNISRDLVHARNANVAPADLGLIIYSSGTTSQPKGMMHIHRAPTLQAWHQAHLFCRTESMRVWSTFPLFWTAGFNTVMSATLAAGGCWIMQELFDSAEAIALIAREKVAEPYSLQHLTAVMEEHPDWLGADFSAVRCVNPNTPFSRHPSVTNLDLEWNGVQGYGSSETCALSVSHRANAPLAIANSSIGRLLAGNILRIVDADTGDILGPDQQGEMCLKGPTLMERYVKKHKEECFDEDGFFHTGDSGFYDADGYVHWTGRSTEMIKTAGANVSPAELEKIIVTEFPNLKISKVLGVDDERLGQMVVMCAVLQDGDTLTEEAVRQRLRVHVAAYKVPKRVLFFDEHEIPMTVNAEKVKTKELRELVEQRLAAEIS